MANWERKSQYLLREIVKFRTYIDTLTNAQNLKQKIYAEREAHERKISDADSAAAAQSLKPAAAAAEEDGAKDAPIKASQPVALAPQSSSSTSTSTTTPAFLLHP